MSTPIVDVIGKRKLEYVSDCLSKFNRGADTLIVRAFGANVSKGLHVAQILTNHFDTKIDKTILSELELEFDKRKSPSIDILLEYQKTKKKYPKDSINDIIDEEIPFSNKNVISYPMYHLLLDSLLNKQKKLSISCPVDERENKWIPVMSIAESNFDMVCEPAKGISDENISNLTDAYYRSGLLFSDNWKDVASRCSEFDDIVVAPDTNILLNTTLTEHFLDYLYLVEPKNYIHTPNWILFVIPSSVMYEIERGTNHRDNNGRLTKIGRIGFRALGEILMITQCIDLIGIGIIITGNSDPALDISVELRRLRAEINNRAKNTNNIDPLSSFSYGDTIIRDQFRRFLRQIDSFKGGSFFLTSDKTNAALAHSEGLNSIYYKIPHSHDADSIVTLYSIPCNSEAACVTIAVPIGKLIYELAVQFGSIQININPTNAIRISCDSKGESIEHWLYKDLLMQKGDCQKLLENYTGRYSLSAVKGEWNDLRNRFFKKYS